MTVNFTKIFSFHFKCNFCTIPSRSISEVYNSPILIPLPIFMFDKVRYSLMSGLQRRSSLSVCVNQKEKEEMALMSLYILLVPVDSFE